MAVEVPKAKNPSSYIRFIYNRVNLEKAVIRAAAVSALANIAFNVATLADSILLLLKKCLNDSDDEVRERAYFYHNLLSKKNNAEVTDFFNFSEEINIEELENYVTENREELTREDSDEFTIDLSQMV